VVTSSVSGASAGVYEGPFAPPRIDAGGRDVAVNARDTRVADLDGDGIDDLVAVLDDAIGIAYGPLRGSYQSLADFDVEAPIRTRFVALADLDGIAGLELLVTVVDEDTGDLSLHAFAIPAAGTIRLGDALATMFVGVVDFPIVDGVGDLDGDGCDEFVFPTVSFPTFRSVVVSGCAFLGGADFLSASIGAIEGDSVGVVPDWNGDGQVEFLLRDQLDSTGGLDAGFVKLRLSPF
jgi:hypothetical protein